MTAATGRITGLGGVPNADDPDFATAYWGANVQRLREVKSIYDPHRVFRYEQGITP